MNKKIQILRGFAIIAVVFIHSIMSGLPEVIIRPFLNYAVALFLFLSGYLTKIDIPDVKNFYKKRTIRVVLPYCIWSVIYTVAAGSYDDFIVNFLTARCCSIYYYIFVYIQLVLLTPLIGRLIRSRYRRLGYAITPVALIVMQYVMTLAGSPVGFPWNAITFPVWFIFYYLGMELGSNTIEIKLDMKKGICFYALAIIISEAEGLLWYWSENHDLATTQLRLSSVLTSLSVIFISYVYIRSKSEVKENLITHILILLGDCSFGMYLSHMLIMKFLARIPGYDLLFFPITSVIIIAVSAVCVMLGKKILGKRFSGYIGL